MNDKKKQGFAALDPEQQRLIASKGGKAAHAAGKGHKFTSETAREAGRKGGARQTREHLVEIGRLGGIARARKHKEQKENTHE